MNFTKKIVLSGLCFFVSLSSQANDYTRANVYQAFTSYINQNKPIDNKYKFDKEAFNDLSKAMRNVKSSSLNTRGNQLNQQFEWWLSRRGNGFVNNESHGPNHGCVGGGNGSRHKSNHKKRKKRGSGGHDDCGGSYN
ncbi:hypothetical protein [Pseudoalteromonas sp. SG43-4]|jgi:hypothetical protein|uniref:hypothetical protein n=1 Tax=Pseudoalteromonas sp. SG43-4 TaxID=2760969 RepID=UPI0015FEF514|nr:hypothetical protein [Pseudoalteromonas sp. SG43-4]MBB1432532.1 hypothetical protein [Pseudoalteromonas sp. SG43-4]